MLSWKIQLVDNVPLTPQCQVISAVISIATVSWQCIIRFVKIYWLVEGLSITVLWLMTLRSSVLRVSRSSFFRHSWFDSHIFEYPLVLIIGTTLRESGTAANSRNTLCASWLGPRTPGLLFATTLPPPPPVFYRNAIGRRSGTLAKTARLQWVDRRKCSHFTLRAFWN